MDHYCPWMTNCIGFYNYRYFVLFLLYMQIGCVYAISILIANLDKLSPVDRSFIVLLSTLQANILDLHLSLSATTFAFSICLAAMISTGVLLVWHLYLCVTNQTTIEFYINFRNKQEAAGNGVTYKNPFDEGWRKNLKRIFGFVPWYRNLLPSWHVPPEPKFAFELEPRPLHTSLDV